MNPDTQKIQLVKDNRQVFADLVIGGLGLAYLYVATNPDVAERLTTFYEKCKSKVIHRISVWAARDAIRNLPETPDD